MNGVRVIIADEHVLYIEALKCLMKAHFSGIEVLDVSHSGPELVDQIRTYEPELVILNVRLPILDGLSIIPNVKSLYPSMKIVVISEYDHPKFIKSAFQGGVDGYILKSNSVEEFVGCLREVLNGLTYMGEGVSIGPLHRKQGNDYETDWDMEDAFMIKSNLTKRELEILNRIADAKNNKEIASELYISDQTVGVHRKNIMKKLNVSTTASLIKMAHDFGIVTS
jgi:DNA-binding NarL/FixJ family response regulator